MEVASQPARGHRVLRRPGGGCLPPPGAACRRGACGGARRRTETDPTTRAQSAEHREVRGVRPRHTLVCKGANLPQTRGSHRAS